MPILSQPVVDEDGVQLVRPLLVLDVRRGDNVLELLDFFLQALYLLFSSLLVFLKDSDRDLDFILLEVHVAVVELVRGKIHEVLVLLGITADSDADFVLD